MYMYLKQRFFISRVLIYHAIDEAGNISIKYICNTLTVCCSLLKMIVDFFVSNRSYFMHIQDETKTTTY